MDSRYPTSRAHNVNVYKYVYDTLRAVALYITLLWHGTQEGAFSFFRSGINTFVFWLYYYYYIVMCALFQVTSPAAMHPAFRLSQWHGHVVVSLHQLRTPAARTTFKNAKRHERHSPDGQRTSVVVPATMHWWDYLYRIYYNVIILTIRYVPILYIKP